MKEKKSSESLNHFLFYSYFFHYTLQIWQPKVL